MDWRNEVQKVTWDVTQGVSNTFEKAVDGAFGFVSGAVSDISGFLGGTSVVGINVAEIPNMKIAIEQYVQQLEAHLETIETQTDTNIAFKGEYAVAVKQYVSAVKAACIAVTSGLLAFADQLTDIQAKYEAYDTTLKSKIGTDASNVESQFQKYTRTTN